jgi:HSP20 family protein
MYFEDFFMKQFREMQEEMEKFLEYIRRRTTTPVSLARGYFEPNVNIVECEDEIIVLVELSGCEPEEINIEIEENNLIITGERKEKLRKNPDVIHRMEIEFGNFQKVINLPENIEIEKIEASYRNGLLEISLPKSQKEVSKKSYKIPVKIKGEEFEEK